MHQKWKTMLAAASEEKAKEDKAITLIAHPSDIASTEFHVPTFHKLCKQHHHVFKCITLGEHFFTETPTLENRTTNYPVLL